MSLDTTCPVCGDQTGDVFVSVADQPVHCNVLFDTAEAALSTPRGDIDLCFCPNCGHVFNARFDPALTSYGGTYENSLHHSSVFSEYATDLVNGLVAKNDLDGGDVVEIGAGQGDFLQELCAAAGARGWGFDPSHVGDAKVSPEVTVVSEFYSESHGDHPADLIICRHVLEHIDQSGAFLEMLRGIVGERSIPLFFEVPNGLWTLRDGGLWDVIYEHCGYFTPTSLTAAFERCGFEGLAISEVFGGQFLTIDARPVDGAEPSTDAASFLDDAQRSTLQAYVDSFQALHTAAVDRWRTELGELRAAGKRAALWGAGSKGVTFLNVVAAATDETTISHVVDINPRKHGMHVAGSGQQIVGPEDLTAAPPDVVIVMNPNYVDEISATLTGLGIDATVTTV